LIESNLKYSSVLTYHSIESQRESERRCRSSVDQPRGRSPITPRVSNMFSTIFVNNEPAESRPDIEHGAAYRRGLNDPIDYSRRPRG